MNDPVNTERLANDLRNVVRDTEELLRAVAGATGEKAEDLRARLEDAINAAKDGCAKLEAASKDALQAADQEVRDHPYRSLGIALAAGVVIGALLSRK